MRDTEISLHTYRLARTAILRFETRASVAKERIEADIRSIFTEPEVKHQRVWEIYKKEHAPDGFWPCFHRPAEVPQELQGILLRLKRRAANETRKNSGLPPLVEIALLNTSAPPLPETIQPSASVGPAKEATTAPPAQPHSTARHNISSTCSITFDGTPQRQTR